MVSRGLGRNPADRRRLAPLRVVMVSDQNLLGETVREGLASRGIETVGAAFPSGPAEMRELGLMIVAARPVAGLVLSDLADALEIQAVVDLMSGIPLRWLVLTGMAPGPPWGAVVEAGAQGILPLTATLDEVRTAVTRLAGGRPVTSPRVLARVLSEWRQLGKADQELLERMSSLTPREMAVLAELSEGKPVKVIAEEVGVAEATVRSQVKSVLRKLGVRSQLAGAAAYRQWGEARNRRRRWPP